MRPRRILAGSGVTAALAAASAIAVAASLWMSGLMPSTAAAQTAAEVRGEAIYDHWCATCHAAGPGHPGTQSLQIKYRGEIPAVLTEREDMTPEFVRTLVRQGILLMAPFRKTEITDSELDDLAAYLTE